MGPSGSGKSTLMQCVAGLDRLTSGSAYIGETELSGLNKTELTLLRRDRLGFIFQQYNLVSSLTARENIVLPLTLAGRGRRPGVVRRDRQDRRAWATASTTCPASSRAASSSGSRWPGPWCRARRSSSPTSRPARSTRAPASRSSPSCAGPSTTSGQTIVMVTHDPHAASYADNVLFLADGQIIDEMPEPTTDRVLDRMKRFEA